MTPPVRVVAVGLWLIVAAGPVLGAVALLRPSASEPAADLVQPPPAVTGLAELVVRAHLTTLPGDVPDVLSPAHPALRLGGTALVDLTTDARQAAVAATTIPIEAAATVRTEPAGPGRWGVTVGVLRSGRPEAWQVTVAEHAGAATVETLPALVAFPDRSAPATPAVSPLRAADPQDDLDAAVQRFLDALLGGDGELQRYVTTGAPITHADVTARSVQLRRIATGPVGPQHLAVLAEVRTTRADGAVHISHYSLLVQRSDDRWEVQRLLPALPVQPRTPPTDPAHAGRGTRSTP